MVRLAPGVRADVHGWVVGLTGATSLSPVNRLPGTLVRLERVSIHGGQAGRFRSG